MADTFLASLQLPAFPPVTPPSTVTVYFVSKAGETVLRVNEPGHTQSNDFNNTITAGIPFPGYATYMWVPAETMIKWNMPPAATSGSALLTGVSNPQNPTPTPTPTPLPTNTPDISISLSIEPSQKIPPAMSSNDPPVPTSSASNTTSKGKTSGVTPGAVAGTAVGSLIAGALIAGLLVWFCLGRSRRRARPDGETSTVALMPREKGATAKALSMESSSPMSLAMESGLPQPSEDKAISGEISKISNLIKNHVQSYYHNSRVSPGLLDFDDVQALGAELPISMGTLSTLLSNAETREIALRFCIAWVIISRMQLRSEPTRTLLPPEIADCFQSMEFLDQTSTVPISFLSKWRVITAQLTQTSYTREPFSTSDPRNKNLAVALRTLDAVLLPYADSRIMDKTERRRNLEEILKRAAAFAFTLFAQPASYDFDWQNEQEALSGSLCVFPALVQIADEAGEPIKPPRAFSDAVVRRLDG